MDYSSSQMAAGLGITASVLLLYSLWRRSPSSLLPLPPSPKSYPLIGNLLCTPTKEEYFGFIEIGKQLGSDIFSLSILGTIVIVLNDLEDAINLLEKRSGIYSDRPKVPMLTDHSLYV
ncbi:hypothetical protein FRC12_009703 [Ceratobasidium sp. 428]|nr:hypothetical protein FRC12_009703 [Ceratobasidium sp. 428]